MNWKRNEIVNGSYKIVKKLGEGWAGEVYSAILLSSNFGLSENTKVALKKYKNHIYTSDPKIIKRIEREANTGITCRHKNLVSIYSIENCFVSKTQFLVMEFCSNGSLNEFVKENKIDNEQILKICKELSEGLNYLHDKGILHRDIKPQNILIDENNIPKIADFGVVKHKDDISITESNLFLGTIRYSAPEYLINGKETKEADVFSLGTVFYQLLYGKDVYSDIKRFTLLVLSINNNSLEFPKHANRFNRTIHNNSILIESLCMIMLKKEMKSRLSMNKVQEILENRDFKYSKLFAITELEKIIANNRKSFNKDKHFVFSRYVAPLVIEKMGEDQITKFLTDPHKEQILSDTELSYIACSPIPRANEYAKLQNEERKRVLDAIEFEKIDFIKQGNEKLDSYNKQHQLSSLFSEYLKVENDPQLTETLKARILNKGDYINY